MIHSFSSVLKQPTFMVDNKNLINCGGGLPQPAKNKWSPVNKQGGVVEVNVYIMWPTYISWNIQYKLYITVVPMVWPGVEVTRNVNSPI